MRSLISESVFETQGEDFFGGQLALIKEPNCIVS